MRKRDPDFVLQVQHQGKHSNDSCVSWVPDGGGFVKNPRTATSIYANLRSFTLITCLGHWKRLEIGLNPRITWTSWSC